MTNQKKNIRVAIIADWLTVEGGAEKVLQSFLKIFPDADFFTSVYLPENFSFLKNTKVYTTYLQKFPHALRKRHQLLFPFLPKAIESLDCNAYDLVISSSTFVAKGIITDENTPHLCYCHTPTRYFWDEWQYFLKEGLNIPKFLNPFKMFFPAMFSRLRIWDFCSAQRPDAYIGNSEYVVGRIQKFYRRNAKLLRPPVDWEKFSPVRNVAKKDHYIALGRIIPYKKFDLLVKTFKSLPNKTLKICGRGPELESLKIKAEGHPNIQFLGFVSDEDLLELLGSARAFLFPQNEDAGIAPMEGLCTGTPIIAYKKGGALGMVDEQNGVFFEEQTPESLIKAIEIFEKNEAKFLKNREKISLAMKKFSTQNFEKNLERIVEKFLQNF